MHIYMVYIVYNIWSRLCLYIFLAAIFFPFFAIDGCSLTAESSKVFAFDEVERKPNSDLWLSRVGFPVHGSRLKKPHSCKDTKMATPLDFCRGMSRPVNWYPLMLRHVVRHVANM